MILFGLTLIVMLIFAIALLILPTLRQSDTQAAASRDGLNKAYYQQRLAELERDEAQGVVAEREALITELQYNLLEDIPNERTDAPIKQAPLNRFILLPGVLLTIVVALGLYWQTGGLTQVMQWQQVMQEMPDLRKRADSGELSSTEEIARFGLGLRTDLLSDPTNVRDWTMLGLAGLRLGKGDTALQAYEKAYALSPNDNDIAIIYARLLTRSNDPNDVDQAGRILKRILDVEPNNVDALSAFAMNAFGQGRLNDAISAWEKTLALLPADAPSSEVIKNSLAYAKAQVAANGYQLTVNVALAPQLIAQLPTDGTLLVTVTDGETAVPVAVKQLPLAKFPLELTLDDSNAMLSTRLLSDLRQVKIKVTVTSNNLSDSQQLVGESAVYPFSGKARVDVTIEHIKQ